VINFIICTRKQVPFCVGFSMYLLSSYILLFKYGRESIIVVVV